MNNYEQISRIIPKVIRFVICKRLNCNLHVSSDAIFVADYGFICDCGFWTDSDRVFHVYVGGGLDV